MPEKKPRPDMALAETEEGQQHLEDFCSEHYEENKEECMALVADKLRAEPEPPEDQGGQPQEPEPQEPEDDPVMDAVMDGQEVNQSMETLVADCVGKGFFGLRRPNNQACFRVIAKHEREKRR